MPCDSSEASFLSKPHLVTGAPSSLCALIFKLSHPWVFRSPRLVLLSPRPPLNYAVERPTPSGFSFLSFQLPPGVHVFLGPFQSVIFNHILRARSSRPAKHT